MQHVWETEWVHSTVLWGDLSERNQLEDLGIDGRIILRWIFRKSDGSMGWIDQVQDRDGWWPLLINCIYGTAL